MFSPMSGTPMATVFSLVYGSIGTIVPQQVLGANNAHSTSPPWQQETACWVWVQYPSSDGKNFFWGCTGAERMEQQAFQDESISSIVEAFWPLLADNLWTEEGIYIVKKVHPHHMYRLYRVLAWASGQQERAKKYQEKIWLSWSSSAGESIKIISTN